MVRNLSSLHLLIKHRQLFFVFTVVFLFLAERHAVCAGL
jgi:hypothetical protein